MTDSLGSLAPSGLRDRVSSARGNPPRSRWTDPIRTLVLSKFEPDKASLVHVDDQSGWLVVWAVIPTLLATEVEPDWQYSRLTYTPRSQPKAPWIVSAAGGAKQFLCRAKSTRYSRSCVSDESQANRPSDTFLRHCIHKPDWHPAWLSRGENKKAQRLSRALRMRPENRRRPEDYFALFFARFAVFFCLALLAGAFLVVFFAFCVLAIFIFVYG